MQNRQSESILVKGKRPDYVYYADCFPFGKNDIKKLSISDFEGMVSKVRGVPFRFSENVTCSSSLQGDAESFECSPDPEQFVICNMGDYGFALAARQDISELNLFYSGVIKPITEELKHNYYLTHFPQKKDPSEKFVIDAKDRGGFASFMQFAPQKHNITSRLAVEHDILTANITVISADNGAGRCKRIVDKPIKAGSLLLWEYSDKILKKHRFGGMPMVYFTSQGKAISPDNPLYQSISNMQKLLSDAAAKIQETGPSASNVTSFRTLIKQVKLSSTPESREDAVIRLAMLLQINHALTLICMPDDVRGFIHQNSVTLKKAAEIIQSDAFLNHYYDIECKTRGTDTARVAIETLTDANKDKHTALKYVGCLYNPALYTFKHMKGLAERYLANADGKVDTLARFARTLAERNHILPAVAIFYVIAVKKTIPPLAPTDKITFQHGNLDKTCQASYDYLYEALLCLLAHDEVLSSNHDGLLELKSIYHTLLQFADGIRDDTELTRVNYLIFQHEVKRLNKLPLDFFNVKPNAINVLDESSSALEASSSAAYASSSTSPAASSSGEPVARSSAAFSPGH